MDGNPTIPGLLLYLSISRKCILGVNLVLVSQAKVKCGVPRIHGFWMNIQDFRHFKSCIVVLIWCSSSFGSSKEYSLSSGKSKKSITSWQSKIWRRKQPDKTRPWSEEPLRFDVPSPRSHRSRRCWRSSPAAAPSPSALPGAAATHGGECFASRRVRRWEGLQK